MVRDQVPRHGVSEDAQPVPVQREPRHDRTEVVTREDDLVHPFRVRPKEHVRLPMERLPFPDPP